MTAPTDVGRGGSAPSLPVHESTPADTRVQVSTGTLPDFATVRDLLAAAHRTYQDVTDGAVADYIPALAQASPDLFGIAVAGVGGRVAGIGEQRARLHDPERRQAVRVRAGVREPRAPRGA